MTRTETSSAWGRVDLVLAALLFLLAAGWFHWLASGASAQGVITGEEASITHRDALALRLGWQPSVWSTNVGAQLFYWAAGHLDPDYGLLYARKWKALATALLAPLAYLVARRWLRCGRGAAVVAGVLVTTVPGVSMLAWVGIETPLDVVAGVTALLLVTSRRRGWWLGLALAGLAVSVYTAALATAVTVLVVAVWRVRENRQYLRALVGLLLGLLVVLWPLLWWRNGGIVVTGGGRAGADPSRSGEHIAELFRYAQSSGASYYYFSDLPVLGGPLVAAALLLAAMLGIAARTTTIWPWALGGVFSVGLYAVSSGVPGSRRIVLAVVVLCLAAAVGTDVVARWAARRVPALSVLVPVAVLVLLAAPLITSTSGWRAEVVAGERALPIDWNFPIDPGGSQASTLARLSADLRAGRLTPGAVGDGWGGTRTLSMIFILDERAGRTPPLTPDDVLSYYWGSSDCPPLDGSACR